MSQRKVFIAPPLLPKDRVRVTVKSPVLKKEIENKLPDDLEIIRLSNLDLETLMKLFKSSKSYFRPILYKALYKIIENYYYKENLKVVNKRLNYYNLEEFINDLFIMKEYALVKEIIKIADKIEPYNGIYDSLIYDLWTDQKALEIYFDMEPSYHVWGNFDEDLQNNLEGMGYDSYDKYFIPVLKAAINTKKIEILEYMIEFWNNDGKYYEEYSYEELDIKTTNIISEIDVLIKQAEMIVSK